MPFFDNLLGRNSQPASFWDELGDGFKLSKKTRLYGFAICFSVGLICAVVATMLLPSLVFGATKFSMIYALGHIMAIASTAFLVGPTKQLKTMFKPKRIVSTLAYIGSLVLVLLLALKGAPVIILIPLVILSFCCLLYYVASYIPFARRCLRSTASSALSV
ncbi:hypothetical protein GEMRC1_006084 [Eukaryota sp. GEM-RC1]